MRSVSPPLPQRVGERGSMERKEWRGRKDQEGQSQMATTGSWGGGIVTGAAGAYKINQSVHGVQVYGAPLSITGGDVHTHVHHHYAGDTSRFPPGWDQIENHRRIQIATLGRATPGTGAWVRQMEAWHIWLDPEGYLKIMWGYGIPGAGKTILASIVIDALEAHARDSPSPISVNYIYFRYSDHSRATVRGFLEILVKQTVERHAHCLSLFDEVYAVHIREKTQPSEAELLGLLQRFTENVVATFYVLDALDEALKAIQVDVVKKLASLNVKIFITSRPMQTVEVHFPSAHRFPIVAQDHDLDLHIIEQISRSPDLQEILAHEPALQTHLVASVKEKCHGMFLHASLQLAALREYTSIHEVKGALASFPTDIKDLYRQTWQRILAQAPGKASLARNALTWVLYATRSLTVQELREVVATCPDTHKFAPDRLVPESVLVGLCQGLVAVEEETQLVRLVHYTAKDTLEGLISETFPQPHALLSAVCLARLADRGFQNTTIDDDQELQQALLNEPLLHYAYNSWFIHTQQSLVDPLTRGRLGEFAQGCHAFPVGHKCLPNFDYSFDLLGPLHLVAFFNLPIASADSDSLQSPNQVTERLGKTALHLACMQGHNGAVEELLRLPNISVNAVDTTGTTALITASELGHEGVIRLLLAHPDTNVNATDWGGRVALFWAASHRRLGAVKLLLSHPDIDVNVAETYGQTPLIKVSEQGASEDVVTLLLSHPDVDVNATNLFKRTALSVASRNGHTGTVKLLLSHPEVEVNLGSKDRRTPLCHAARHGREDVVRLLLTHRAIEVGTRELEEARNEGHHSIVQLLEEFSSRSD
ncbi:hypothetical protein BKA70DRAFT_1425484 [Coprinopsis sp. MPI-PUGE-AT-0042]|nr:hypothetical protein BKA70DRAFT_1425484 [Coprinopsis sp. MPI-PUGE-AT-0042]